MVADDIPRLTMKADAERGLWTLSTTAGALGRPVVSGDTVYLQVSDSRIAALDAQGGRIRWCGEALTQPDPDALVCGGGAVVVPVQRDYDRSGFTALDAATGEVRWTRRKSGLHEAAAAGSTVVLWNASGEDRSRIAGVDALTGETLWEDEFERIGDLLVRGDRVIFEAGGYRALDARTGGEVWHEGYGSLLEQDGISDGAVFHDWSGGFSPALAIRASDTGKPLATTYFPKRALKDFSSPPTLVDGGRVLFSRPFERRVLLCAYAGLDQAVTLGKQRLGRWRLTSFSQPAVCVGDWVYALSLRQRLYAAKVGGKRGLRQLAVAYQDGWNPGALRPTEITAGPGHVFAADWRAVAAVRDGRVLWAAAADVSDNLPVPLGADRVLFRSSSRDRRVNRLHCADAETGRRLT